MRLRFTLHRSIALSAVIFLASVIASPAQGSRSPLEKLDPRLRMRLVAEAKGDVVTARLFGADDDPDIRIFIKGDPATLRAIVEKHGGSIGTMATDIATARIPRAALHALAAEESIARIEGGMPLVLDNEHAAVEIGADRVWSPEGGGVGYTGEGVVVGVIDTGIDWTHLDFREEGDTLTTRIVSIWDQLASAGPAPSGYEYGTYISHLDMLRAIKLGTWSSIRHADVQGHGTHVAGTAAGSGIATGRHKGMAPDAKIVAVRIDPSSSTGLFDAAAFIFAEADRLRMPAVINISLGFDEQPHDGNSLADEGIDQLLAARPGRVVCASAGNKGSDRSHWMAAPGSTPSWTWAVPAGTGSGGGGPMTAMVYLSGIIRRSDIATTYLALGIDSLVRTGSLVEPKLTDQTAWTSFEELATSTNRFALGYGNGRFGAVATVAVFPLNDRELEFFIMVTDSLEERWTDENMMPRGIDFIRLMTTGTGSIHLWREHGDSVASAILASTPPPGYSQWGYGYSVRSPGSARSVLTVGAYNNIPSYVNHRGDTVPTLPLGGENGALASFSSAGPTLDGRMKPEIVAPGKGVISALSEASRQDLIDTRRDQYIAAGDRHVAYSGTSMSTPVTTGAIALYLQKFPTASYQQVREAIISSARTDSFTASHGPLPNAHWGYGKLDIAAALNHISSVDEPVAGRRPGLTVRPSVARDHIVVEFAARPAGGVTLELCDLLGARVRALQVDDDSMVSRHDLSDVPPGFYFVRLNGAAVPVVVSR